MDFVDSKFISLVSSRLEKFKQKKSDLYNCRCPICGDSSRNRTKARGYIYAVKQNTNYKCHNCGVSMSFSNFIKEIDPVLHKQYVFEKFKGKNSTPIRNTKSVLDKFSYEPKFKKKTKIDLPSAFDVKLSKEYLDNRKITSGEFYYTDNFKEFVNVIKPGTFDDERGGPRIVIPLYDMDGVLFGLQGRSLLPSKVKYITIILDEDQPKVYGLEKIDPTQRVYLVEGPFDSTFINNSLAMCGADVVLDTLGLQELVYVYDNEPRNREICNRINKVIDQGKKVVIFPTNIEQKDINDMILAGHDIMTVLGSNVYQGLTAKIKYNEWKRL